MVFAHSVNENIGAAFDKYRRPDPIVPIVVICKTAERCLKPADNNGHIGIYFSDLFAIDRDGAIGAFSGLVARRIGVVAAAFFCSGIVSHHGIYISRIYHKGIFRAAETFEIGIGFPVRLSQNSNPEALGLDNAGNNGGSECRMIHIGVPGYDDKIKLVPAPLFHVLFVYG